MGELLLLKLFSSTLLTVVIINSVINRVSSKWVVEMEENFDKELDPEIWTILWETNNKGNFWTDKTVSVENGMLVLRAEETFNSNGTRELLQSQVYSKYASWSEGLFKMRLKLPRGDHLQGMVWFDEVNRELPGTGIIDVVFLKNKHDNYTIQSGLNAGRMSKFYGFKGKLNTTSDITEEFHEFVVEWTKWDVTWSVDGNVYCNESLRQYFPWKDNIIHDKLRMPFDRNFFLKFEVNFNFKGNSDVVLNQSSWTQPRLYVDYFKSYKWVEQDEQHEGFGGMKKYILIFSTILVSIILLILLVSFLVLTKIRKKNREIKELSHIKNQKEAKEKAKQIDNEYDDIDDIEEYNQIEQEGAYDEQYANVYFELDSRPPSGLYEQMTSDNNNEYEEVENVNYDDCELPKKRVFTIGEKNENICNNY